MSVSLKKIQEARSRIQPFIEETPLLHFKSLDSFLHCQVYIKAECMQTTGSFKLRGAMNKILQLNDEQLQGGIVAASSGNHGKAVAYAAKMRGAKATIIMPFSAPTIKTDAIRALGAEVVQCEVSERFAVAEKICGERNATMVPPFNDEDVIAGQGTLGLEILEQCSDIDKIVVPVSGGGLLGGLSTAVKGTRSNVTIYGAEPSCLPRYTVSLAQGCPTKVAPQKSIADALVAQIPGDKCFPLVQANTDCMLDVDDDFILKGMKLLLLEGKILCEPSSAIGIGAVLQGLVQFQPEDKVCFLISGGSVGLEQLMGF